MQCHIRDYITRHDSVTDVHEDEISEDARSSCSEHEKFEDARASCSDADQSQAVPDETALASTRTLNDAGLLERILPRVMTKSDRANTQAILRASRVNKIWRETITKSLELQRCLWFSPCPQASLDKGDIESKTPIRFNPILWPMQPEHCTMNVTHRQLNTGNRGPGSWRRMLVASGTRAECMMGIEVAGLLVAIVKCTASTTMGMLLEAAKKNAGEPGNFVEPRNVRAWHRWKLPWSFDLILGQETHDGDALGWRRELANKSKAKKRLVVGTCPGSPHEPEQKTRAINHLDTTIGEVVERDRNAFARQISRTDIFTHLFLHVDSQPQDILYDI
ncbi:hypothetical protein BST61_g10118 [Cercospora zeina]